MLLSKKKSKARCIARVNNPANKLIFESLDPEDPVTVISSTELILDVLNEQVNASKYRAMLETMHLFGKGNMQLVKVEIPPTRRSTPNAWPKSTCRTTPSSSRSTGPTRISRFRPATRLLHAGDSMIVIVKNGAAERIHAHRRLSQARARYSPCAAATTAACVRSEAESFSRMSRMWPLTVPRPM